MNWPVFFTIVGGFSLFASFITVVYLGMEGKRTRLAIIMGAIALFVFAAGVASQA